MVYFIFTKFGILKTFENVFALMSAIDCHQFISIMEDRAHLYIPAQVALPNQQCSHVQYIA